MERIDTPIPGCFVLKPRAFSDHRGRLVKTYHQPTLRDLGITPDYEECYFSTSHAGVLRGMHFQVPPYAQAKLAACLSGRLLDVVVDLRVGSPSYGQFFSQELSAANGLMMFIPEGLAHGFYVLEPDTIIQNFGSVAFNSSCDGGIRWNSFGFGWPDETPIVSEKDANLPEFSNFESPFQFFGQID